MSGVFLIISNNSTNNYSLMSPWFFFRSLNSKYHPWTGLDTISPFPDTRHGTAMTSSLCKLSIKYVMSSLIPSMVQGLDPSDLLRADLPQPEVLWRQVLRVGRPGSVCLTGDDLVSKVGLKEISDQLSGVAPGTILL